MKKKQPTERYFPRGPEIIPRSGTWQHEEYQQGRRFFMGVLEGQRFPNGASPKELDRLAHVRAGEIAREEAEKRAMAAAEQAVAHTAQLEQPEPIAETIAETIAA